MKKRQSDAKNVCGRCRSGFQARVYHVYSHRPCINYMRVFLSVICEPPASESLGCMLEIHIPGIHTRPLSQNL